MDSTEPFPVQQTAKEIDGPPDDTLEPPSPMDTAEMMPRGGDPVEPRRSAVGSSLPSPDPRTKRTAPAADGDPPAKRFAPESAQAATWFASLKKILKKVEVSVTDLSSKVPCGEA